MNMPTEEDVAYMMEHIDDSLVPDMIASCAISSALALVILALRVWSRYQISPRLVISDYLVVLSVVSSRAEVTFVRRQKGNLTRPLADILHSVLHSFCPVDALRRRKARHSDYGPRDGANAGHCESHMTGI
jgi:hypothetical protein